MSQDAASPISFLSYGLTIFALCAITFAQPLYTALGDGASFFVAHNASPLQIFIFVALVSLGVPLLILAIEYIVSKFNPALARGLHAILTMLLATGFCLMLFNKFWTHNPIAAVVLAAALGLIYAILWNKKKAVRDITAFASPGVILFPILFLGFTPVASIVFGAKSSEFKTVASSSTTPVVMVIFDEFSPIGLLDSQRQIDPVRFPNFAQFAQHSTWYPNAASVSQYTNISVPSIVTGMLPPAEKRLPNQADYPNNLFTLLGENYSYNVNEVFSQLCPLVYCSENSPQKQFKASAFWSDILVITQHVFYPKNWAEKYLPILTGGWNGFAKTGPNTTAESPQGKPDAAGINTQLQKPKAKPRKKPFRYNDPLDAFASGVEKIQNGAATLDFVHTLLPHQPWVYLPNGQRYQEHYIGLDWDTQEKADEVYHRYLMQLGTVDRLLGDLLDRLKTSDKYDDALIVVMADHGLSFQKNTNIRGLEENPSILHIPLFIKLPLQRKSVIDERFALSIDVLPTIAEALEIDLPWTVDGQSLISENKVPHETVTIIHKKESYSFTQKDIVNFDVIPNRIVKFGERTPLENLAINGRYGEYIGRSTAELETIPAETIGSFDLKIPLDRFQNVSLTAEELPVMLSSEISLSSDFGDDISIGIGLNGVISSIVPLSGKGEKRQFSMLLPPAKLTQGANNLEAFLLVPDPSKEDKVNILNLFIEDDTYSLSEDWTHLLDGRGQAIPIRKIKSKGLASATFKNGGDIFFIHGWAADVSKLTPATKIVLLKNGNFITSIPVNQTDAKLMKTYKNEALRFSRFRADVHKDRMTDTVNARLFAIYPGGYASELTLYVPSYVKPKLGDEGFILSKNWKELKDGTGQKYSIREISPRGLVVAEKNKDPSLMSYSGWAADIKNSQSAEKVIIFRGYDYIQSVAVDAQSLDLVEKHKDKNLITSRFRSEISLDRKTNNTDVRFFAIYPGGYASEISLYIPPSVQPKIENEGFALSSSSKTLTDKDGNTYPIKTLSPAGYVTRNVNANKKTQSFYGWAADVSNSIPAQTVLVFKDNKYIKTVAVNSQAHDVVKTFEDQNLYISRFRVNLPLSPNEQEANVRLFGIYPGGYASELTLQ